MAPIYNSRDLDYKKPFGAVRTGETISFTIRVPRTYMCREPRMMLQRDGELAQSVAMEPLGREADTDMFRVELATCREGLYFYWFDLWSDFKKIYTGPDGCSVISYGDGKPWQFIVYDADFKAPNSVLGSVMYQIFPDRFSEGNSSKTTAFNERIYRDDKQHEPYYWSEEQEADFIANDYFGGDFEGIIQRLPYLESLGVEWIYLNPIFEAHSNDRYGVADYLNADPYLGTNEDFVSLCKKAKSHGIKIMLDGVFNQTGSDSIYFNKEGRYPNQGAWQGETSPYRSWYMFNPDGSYESWWGIDRLPKINTASPEYRNFICGKDGVIDTWMKRGASGFRLNAADELSDDFIAEIREAVKRNGAGSLLIGEVWEDASNKISYDKRRTYLWGKELDGIMNYPFRNAVIQFLKTLDPEGFANAIMEIAENYPQPALSASLNHISTHNTLRAITALAGDEYTDQNKEWQSNRKMTIEQLHLGMLKLKLAFVLQFTLPGVPCIYYGDEIAMQGYMNPFNRAFYDWNSKEERIIPLIKELSQLRKSCAAFKDGDIRFLRASGGVLMFQRQSKKSKAVVALNCSSWPVELDFLGEKISVPVMGYAWKTNSK